MSWKWFFFLNWNKIAKCYALIQPAAKDFIAPEREYENEDQDALTAQKEFKRVFNRSNLAVLATGVCVALFMAAEGTIPAKGFIAGCPAARSPVSLETARAAAERGIRGTIFVGAEDWTAASAETTVSNFEQAGNPVNHIVMDDKGHEFPDDFDEMLRELIRKIYQSPQG